MRKHDAKAGICAVLLALTAGCAPIALSAQYSPPAYESIPSGTAGGVRSVGTCRVGLGEVRDLRSDTQAMGQLHGVTVTASDTAGWLRSAFQSLNRDKRLQFDDKSADLVVSAELLKAYVTAPTSNTRSANVVVRVRYNRPGTTPEEKIYRGTDSGLNWSNGRDETQASLDESLGDILKDVDRDILTRCSAAQPASN
jgi:hypothetical protein